MSASKYAKNTTVSTNRSRDELESLLTRYGVQHFGVANQPDMIVLIFQAGGHHHRIVIPLPAERERRFIYGPGGGARTVKGVKDARAQEIRARHRALVLVVKGKLELAHLLNQPLETAFTEFRVLNDGRTVQEHVTGTQNPPALTWGDH